MRATLRTSLFSLVVSFALAAGCASQPDETFTTSGGEGGFVDTGSGIPSVSGGAGGPSLPPGVWFKHYGDSADQKAGALAVNGAGEAAITGSARGTINFGNLDWMGGAADTDVVVAKLSSEGQALWSRRYGDSCDQHGNAVALAASGNVLVAGDFCGKMDFGATAVEASAGDTDVFVALIDAFGDDIYSRRLGGVGAQSARAAAMDEQGNAVLVGSFNGAFDDGTGSAASSGMDDIFVLKLDPKGNVLWSRRFGGPETDLARSVALDAKGNVIVGGSFGGSVDFGAGPLVATSGHSSGFVLALDPTGKPLWSQGLGGDEDVIVHSVAVNDSGEIAATGAFTGTADFGGGPVKSLGEEDVFLTLMDFDGKPLWNHTFGGTKSQIGTGVTFGANGNMAISGTSEEALDFGLGYPLTSMLPDTPHQIYAVRFSDDGTPLTGWVLGSVEPLESVGIGLDDKFGTFLAGSFQNSVGYNFGYVQSKGGWDMAFSRSE